MHTSSGKNGQYFFQQYINQRENAKVLDIGSYNYNGSLKEYLKAGHSYVGLDVQAGPGVDIVCEDQYRYPFEDNHFDFVVSSSTFRYAEFFWLSFLEIMRVLKPNGIFYLSATSYGPYQSYLPNCWDLGPEAGIALTNWGRRNGMNMVLLESFINRQDVENTNDFVAVFLKDEAFADDHLNRILQMKNDFWNGRVYGAKDVINPQTQTEEQYKLDVIAKIATGQIKLP